MNFIVRLRFQTRIRTDVPDLSHHGLQGALPRDDHLAYRAATQMAIAMRASLICGQVRLRLRDSSHEGLWEQIRDTVRRTQ